MDVQAALQGGQVVSRGEKVEAGSGEGVFLDWRLSVTANGSGGSCG
jgi:hypothetical protein